MKRAFMLGVFTTSLAMLGLALYVAGGGVQADGPQPQYVYQVMLSPGAGGPIVLTTEVPECRAFGVTKIETIDGRVLYTIGIPIFVERSKEKLNVEMLRQRLTAPVLQTQEAQGPAKAPNKG